MSEHDKIKVILSKVGMDTHTTGVRLVAQILRDAGMEVVYLGKYQTPDTILRAAIEEDADVIGISSLGLSFNPIFELMRMLGEKNMDDVIVVVGGTIPKPRAIELKNHGVSGVFVPGSDSQTIVSHIMSHVKRKQRRSIS